MRLFGHRIKFTHDRGNSCGEHHNAANGTWHAIWLKINSYFCIENQDNETTSQYSFAFTFLA